MDKNSHITMSPMDESLLKEELAEEIGSEYTENLAIYSPFRVDADILSGDGLAWQDFLLKVNSCSEKVQNVLISSGTTDFLADIAETLGFSINQSKELSRIVRGILLADIFWGDFPVLISSRLRVDANTANQIIRMVSDELLAPALEEIKTMQKSKFGDRIAQARHEQLSPGAPPPAPAPHRPVGFMQPSETVQQGNVVDLRNREN